MENIEIGTIIFDYATGNTFRVDSEYKELQKGYWCTYVEVDEYGNVTGELTSGWKTRKEVEKFL